MIEPNRAYPFGPDYVVGHTEIVQPRDDGTFGVFALIGLDLWPDKPPVVTMSTFPTSAPDLDSVQPATFVPFFSPRKARVVAQMLIDAADIAETGEDNRDGAA